MVNSIFLVAYTKLSGLLRDLLIVMLLGLTSTSDAIFFGMSLLMLFQLAMYHGNVNVLGEVPILSRLLNFVLKKRKAIAFLYLLIVVLAGQLFYWLVDSGLDLFDSYLICFLLLVPLSMVMGLVASYGVLQGNKGSHVEITSIQNTVTIISALIFFFLFDEKLVFLSWFFGHIAVVLSLGFIADRASVVDEAERQGRKIVISSFLSPALMLLIVLIERAFYSNVEGSIGLIKLLETGALSIMFLMEVLFLNPVLSRFSREKNTDSYKKNVKNALLVTLKKVMPFGLILMFFFLIFFACLHSYSLLPFSISDELDQYVIMLLVLYYFYFMVVVLRDHIERYYFLVFRSDKVLSANIFVLVFMLFLNIYFLGYAPLSIAAISITLMFMKVLYLIVGIRKASLKIDCYE